MRVEPNRNHKPTAWDWFWIAVVASVIIVSLVKGIVK